MTFETEKYKREKIENRQTDIASQLSKSKKSVKLKNELSSFVTPQVLLETDYQAFSSTAEDSSVSHSIVTTSGITSTATFTGTLAINDELIPYIHPQLLIKPLPNADISNYYLIDVYGWDNVPDTTITLEPNKIIFRAGTGIIIGNTGATGVVTSTVNALIPGLLDRKISSSINGVATPLYFSKVSTNEWTYRLVQRIGMKLKTENNVGTFNLEGEFVYTPNYSYDEFGNPVTIASYDRADNRVPVSYDAYRVIEYDVEAKLILSYLPKQIANNRVEYKS